MNIETPSLGRLIVIDGIDGCGKATQVACLVKALRGRGHYVKTMSFPRYNDCLSGRFLDRCLHGDYGDFTSVDPYIASYPYAHDRQQAAPIIREWLEQGNIVVLDRYQSANIIHQGGKFKTVDGLREYVNWLDELEFNENNIPKPDLVIVFSIPSWVSRQLIQNRNQVRTVQVDGGGNEIMTRSDVSEEDHAYQRASEENIKRIFEVKSDWMRIDCFDDAESRLLSIDEVHERVIACVDENLQIETPPWRVVKIISQNGVSRV